MPKDEFWPSKSRHPHLWIKVRQFSFRVKVGLPQSLADFEKVVSDQAIEPLESFVSQ
jgi:hypothetical protein